MAERKQLINRHSGIENNVPIGDLNLGEIGINHCNVKDAAIYVETNKDNPSSATLATFITETAINEKINNVVGLIENLTDTVELIDSGLTIEIERAISAEESISGDVTTLAKATKEEFKTIDGLIENLNDAVELIDSGLTIEIERAISAEESISGDVTTLAKATKEEFKSIDGLIENLNDAVELIDSGLTIETERATSAETVLRETIEENEEIVSAALNDLNEKIQSISSVEVIDCGTY